MFLKRASLIPGDLFLRIFLFLLLQHSYAEEASDCLLRQEEVLRLKARARVRESDTREAIIAAGHIYVTRAGIKFPVMRAH